MLLTEEQFDPRWTEKGRKQRELKSLGWNIRGDTACRIENGLIIELTLSQALRYHETLSKYFDTSGNP